MNFFVVRLALQEKKMLNLDSWVESKLQLLPDRLRNAPWRKWAKKAAIVSTVGFGVLFGAFLYAPIIDVHDTSMGATIPPGSRVLMIRSVEWWPPKRGEIVITKFPPRLLSYLQTSKAYRKKYGDKAPPFTLLKRVVGVPGDKEEWNGQWITLGVDEYWLEGDNREKSIDSRFAHFGSVKREQLVGRAYLILKGG
jgi:type IV secretory pathway protease TraF